MGSQSNKMIESQRLRVHLAEDQLPQIENKVMMEAWLGNSPSWLLFLPSHLFFTKDRVKK